MRYHPATSASLRRCQARAVGARIVDPQVALPGLQKLRLPPRRSVTGAVAVLSRSLGDAAYALPNTIGSLHAEASNDPLFPRAGWGQRDTFWWLLSGAKCPDRDDPRTCTYRGIGAADAWPVTRGDPTFRLGLVDTGFETAKGDFDRKPKWYSSRRESNFSGTAAIVTSTFDGVGPDGKTNKFRDPEVRPLTREPGVCKTIEPPGRQVGKTLECLNDDQTRDHGTAVAWFAAAFGNNKRFGSGVMQRAAIVPVAFRRGATDEMVEALDWIATVGRAEVVNISMGFGPFLRKRSTLGRSNTEQLLSDVMARNRDTLFVWAAGNDGFNLDTAIVSPRRQPYAAQYCKGSVYTLQPTDPRAQGPDGQGRKAVPNKSNSEDTTISPCTKHAFAYDAPCSLAAVQDIAGNAVVEPKEWRGERGRRGNMICVAATDMAGQLAPFSNYGRQTVEFAAPGTDLIAPHTGSMRGQTHPSEGTSYSAPLVAGVAGLVRSKYPQLSATAVKCVLMNAAARAPLPPQDIDKVGHPAFLQLQDTILNRPADLSQNPPLTSVGDRRPGPGRLSAGDLMRVMGIPNARYALDEAAAVAADQDIGFPNPCLSPDEAPTDGDRPLLGASSYREGTDLRLFWSIPAPPDGEVRRVEVEPTWLTGRNRWITVWRRFTEEGKRRIEYCRGVDVDDPADRVFPSGRIVFPAFGSDRKKRTVLVRLRVTFAGGARVLGRVTTTVIPEAANPYWQKTCAP